MVITLDRNYYDEDYIRDSNTLQEMYSDVLKIDEIGTSYDGRKILMLKVGVGAENLVYTGGIHGRESINTIVLMKMVETYCRVFYGEKVELDNNWKETISNALKKYSFYYIPLMNPDGYMIALKGYDVIRDVKLRDYIKSFGIPYYDWKYNARGIDLNRNFPSVTWRSQSPNPDVDLRSGEYPGSELETQALIGVFERMETLGYFDYHSRGKVIYYYRTVMSLEYNMIQNEIAIELSKVTGYTLGNPEEEFGADMAGGNSVHYYSETYEKPAITIETVPGDAGFPLNIIYQQETYNEINKTPYCLVRLCSNP